MIVELELILTCIRIFVKGNDVAREVRREKDVFAYDGNDGDILRSYR